MEALVALVAALVEALVTATIALVSAGISLIALLVEILGKCIIWLANGRKEPLGLRELVASKRRARKKQQTNEGDAGMPGRGLLPPWAKRLGRYAAILGVVLLVTLAVINFFFFEPVVGGVVKSQLAKRGVELNYSAFDGNVFTGRVELADLKVKGEQWDVSVEALETNVAMLSLLSSTKGVEKLHVSGVRGNAEMRVPEGAGKKKPKKEKKKKRSSVVIKDLKVEDASMALSYGNGSRPPIHSVRIASLQAEKFKSRWALFYLFFRSNLSGELNGKTFEVTVEDREPLGKRTRWNLTSLPLAPLGSGGGVFSMFEGGEITLDVRDDWLIDEHLEIDMDWRLTLTDVRAKAPPGSVVRKALATYLNSKQDPIEIQFGLKLDPENFEGSSSEAANALYQGVSDALMDGLAQSADITKKKAGEMRDEALDRAKGLLDKLRK